MIIRRAFIICILAAGLLVQSVPVAHGAFHGGWKNSLSNTLHARDHGHFLEHGGFGFVMIGGSNTFQGVGLEVIHGGLLLEMPPLIDFQNALLVDLQLATFPPNSGVITFTPTSGVIEILPQFYPLQLDLFNFQGGVNLISIDSFTFSNYSSGVSLASPLLYTYFNEGWFAGTEHFGVSNYPGGTFDLDMIQVIPEPRTYVLLLGLAAFGLTAWRRKSHRA
jgi:hypothetical protein